jgi:hypothetical protein
MLACCLPYLKLSGRKVGWLINFNVRRLKDAIRRKVNLSRGLLNRLVPLPLCVPPWPLR